MLIIDADDLGRDAAATDTTLECFQAGRLSCASAMVFMGDSERGFNAARSAGLRLGLHINFTHCFDGIHCPPSIARSQRRIQRFLKLSKYSLIAYNPFLTRDFRAVFNAQLAEFRRLYGSEPLHFDGHQHMHLATNMLLHRIIPAGVRVRRSFSFASRDKGWLNRAYRSAVDRSLAKAHPITDLFFALSTQLETGDFRHLLMQSRGRLVELMIHTWNPPELQWLTGEGFAAAGFTSSDLVR
jgi:predicted glycoside hydrolase/deacetylase ChbG (UPF0249 family)